MQSSNPLRSLRNACASPRPARCGASWPFARACPADSPNIPSAAAKSCAAARRAATAARALVPRLERHESGAAGLRAERPPSAQPRIASMPTALPRRPKQARAMLIPFMLLTLARRLLRPRRSKTTWARRACRGVLGAGPQAACAASRCGPLEPPFLSIPPLKDALKAERSSTGGPEHDVQQSEQEISRDWPRFSRDFVN